ncbi:conserved Plasmodium protein, unknown function [Plasmodium malariae]|uniref:Protease n=1 Tax=Plasmodium malariae TaxID=5858 RepID=A0A1C3KZL6_PLAMA|nr:conserved Plasmodium protein, unknown function [Plasmodium malariae]
MYYRKLTDDYYEEVYTKNVENISFIKIARMLYCFFSVILLLGFSCITHGNKGIVYLIYSFFPSCVYLYWFRRKIKRKIKFSHVIEMILYGAILSIFFAGILEYILSFCFFYFCHICFLKEIKETPLLMCSLAVFFYFFFIVAYVEELSKFFPMIFVHLNSKKYKKEYTELPFADNNTNLNENLYDKGENKKDDKMIKFNYIYVNSRLEYIFFSLCSSAGFSSSENLFYTTQTTRQNFLTVITLRNLICVLFHMCCSGVSSNNVASHVHSKNTKGARVNVLHILCSLFSSSLFHAVYDYSIYFSSLNIPTYQVWFLTILFTYSFLSMLLMFFVVIKRIV